MTRPALQLWGGIEASIVRIGDRFRDQVAETGHAGRFADIDAIASLGIKTLRYPILWERVAPDAPDRLDFAWHDDRLQRLRDHGIRVVAGLVHHGSGPRYTDLTDPDWGAKLADYAARVAERYPWIDAWVPVNEPLTTARFSCLYGHWYPHLTRMSATLRALVVQCEGIAASMRAIRAVNPGALLLATEDIGKSFSTPALAYQAEHENDRRWLSFDLLTGRIGPGHPFHDWMLRDGITPDRIDAFRDGAAAPDLIGVDHYLTSERYLDEDSDTYPDVAAGSNGRHSYVDVEAVRIASLAGDVGPAARLREVWQRYGIPMIVGEIHHGCTREEQVRWLDQVWRACEEVRGEGVDVRAATIWALFGVVDWQSLLTREDGQYEVGAFDIRAAAPRPTLLAKAARSLAAGEKIDHPVLAGSPWWKRSERHYVDAHPTDTALLGGQPLLITGASGTLGQAFARLCHHRGLAHVVTDRRALDITDAGAIAKTLDRLRPWAVINTAGFVRAAEEAEAIDACFRTNATGPDLLARAARDRGISFVTFSSDLVFDGQLGRPYVEPDATAPSCVYGQSKADAEDRVLAIDPSALVIRTSAFFGPWDRYNFLWSTLDTLHRGEEVVANDKAIVTPTYVPDLVHAALDLLLDGESGLWHLANQGSVSWHGFATLVADHAGFDVRRVRDGGGASADTSLATSRGFMLRPLDDAIADFLTHGEALPHR